MKDLCDYLWEIVDDPENTLDQEVIDYFRAMIELE